jgi:tRNA A-37 threonylcarbamoyl transferase component Bud32
MAVDNRVGPYRILRLINRGGQGSVYLGYDKRLHRRVAIKIYRLPAQRAARKRLLREAQLVASIQSPKVVQIHDVIESSEHLALVMEYVPGCDLEEFLASVRPSLATVLTIGADIAGALAVARQQHIVHGDLKAGNILIAESGRVKLTDFGIARSTGESPSRQMTAASLSALSPEQYQGKPLDLRSDLFALGCLLYRMLSGEQPFMRGGQLDTHLLLEQSPRPLEELVASDLLVPGELVGLISDLLQKDPEDRPANTQRVRQVLRRVSREIPLAATNSLLQEARPCFRAESADDIPPQVPADLGREGRSRLPLIGGGSTFRHRLSLLAWPARCAAVLVLVVAAGVPLLIAMQERETFIHIDEPLLRLSGDIDLPREVSSRWLVEEVKLALKEQLGALHVTGPVGATRSKILYASGEGDNPPSQPQEQFQIALRCAGGLCVFAINREHAAQHYYKQGVLFPDMPISQWRDIVRSTTSGLYQ